MSSFKNIHQGTHRNFNTPSDDSASTHSGDSHQSKDAETTQVSTPKSNAGVVGDSVITTVTGGHNPLRRTNLSAAIAPSRRPEDIFNYAESTNRTPKPTKPGYFGAILRGTDYKPVFGKSEKSRRAGSAPMENFSLQINLW